MMILMMIDHALCQFGIGQGLVLLRDFEEHSVLARLMSMNVNGHSLMTVFVVHGEQILVGARLTHAHIQSVRRAHEVRW